MVDALERQIGRTLAICITQMALSYLAAAVATAVTAPTLDPALLHRARLWLRKVDGERLEDPELNAIAKSVELSADIIQAAIIKFAMRHPMLDGDPTN